MRWLSEMAQWIEVPAAKPDKLSSIHRTHMLEGESMAVNSPLPLYWCPSHLARIQSKNMNVILKRKKEKAEEVDLMVEPFPDWHSTLSWLLSVVSHGFHLSTRLMEVGCSVVRVHPLGYREMRPAWDTCTLPVLKILKETGNSSETNTYQEL